MPPCGGAPNLSASSRKPNFFSRLLGADAEQLEHGRLHLVAMDTHRAAADFGAVQHHVVGAGQRLARAGLERHRIVVDRRGERVVHRGPALAVGIPLEHREVDDPERRPACADEAEVLADLEAQRADRVVDDLGLVGAEENQVAGLRARALHEAGHRGVRQELEDRRLQAFAALGRVVDLDVREALRAVARRRTPV